MAKPFSLVSLKKFISTYPIIFGMLVGLILVVGVIVIVDWLPKVSEAWDSHNEDVRSGFFTLGLFAIMIFRFWRFHRRGAFVFWASILSLFLLHTASVILYTIRVHPLLLREWMALIIVEPFLIVIALNWMTKRFAHTQKPPHPGFPNADPDQARR